MQLCPMQRLAAGPLAWWQTHSGPATGADGNAAMHAHLVADLAHACVVVVPGVRRRAGNDELRAEEQGCLLEAVVVDEAGRLIEAVWQRLEEDGRCGDALLRGVEAVREVAAVGEVEAHDAVVGLQECSVNCEVGRGAGVWLNVDAPLVGCKAKDFACAVLQEAARQAGGGRVKHGEILVKECVTTAYLAKELYLIDVLVATIVSCIRASLRILVGHA